MNARANTEDQLVERPAIGLFAELGWQVALPHSHPGPLPVGEGAAGPPPTVGIVGEPRGAGLLGRETKGEVVIVPRLRAALEKLNPTLPREAIAAAIDELTREPLLPCLLSGRVELALDENDRNRPCTR